MGFTKRQDRPLLAYRVTNLVNGKVYIGITSRSVDRRWTEHRSNAKHGRQSLLCQAIRKYGPDNFTIEVIAQAQNWDDLCAIERALVKQFDSHRHGYNASQGGDVRLGYVRGPKSEAFKQQMRELFTGRIDSEETRRRKCEAQRRRALSRLNGLGPVTYAGVPYPRMVDAAKAAGVSRPCFWRWVKHFGPNVPALHGHAPTPLDERVAA